MNHIMFDLETMGNSSDAAIVAIGAVKFNTKNISEFYTVVDLQSSIDYGLTVTASTIMWWLEQSDEARGALKDTPISLMAALECLGRFVSKDDLVWGNGATFDNVIITNAYKACHTVRPWGFRNDRCFRTVKSLYPSLDIPDTETSHNALEDARWQAEYLMQLFKREGITYAG